jgi:hypothetical protein
MREGVLRENDELRNCAELVKHSGEPISIANLTEG